MAIQIHIVEDKLSDGSAVYRVTMSDDETPPGEVVSLDAVSYADACTLAGKLAACVADHTNQTVVWS